MSDPDKEITLSKAKLLEVYMDGFLSGCCSALSTFSPLPRDIVIEVGQQIADTLVESGAGDLMDEVEERLMGIDTGAKQHNVLVPVPESLVRYLAKDQN